jgi:hypothetical protein
MTMCSIIICSLTFILAFALRRRIMPSGRYALSFVYEGLPLIADVSIRNGVSPAGNKCAFCGGSAILVRSVDVVSLAVPEGADLPHEISVEATSFLVGLCQSGVSFWLIGLCQNGTCFCGEDECLGKLEDCTGRAMGGRNVGCEPAE